MEEKGGNLWGILRLPQPGKPARGIVTLILDHVTEFDLVRRPSAKGSEYELSHMTTFCENVTFAAKRTFGKIYQLWGTSRTFPVRVTCASHVFNGCIDESVAWNLCT